MSHVVGHSRMLGMAAALAALGVSGASLPSISVPKARRGRVLASNGTFNDGRNAEKRKARTEARTERAIQVDAHQRSEFGVRHAPKCRLSVLEMNMLANRRLRQTRGGL